MDAVAPTPRLRLPTPRRVLKLRSDAALVDRFQAGDEAAFAALYDRHRATVLAVCMGVLGSRHDAEDAAQETFASLTVALRTAPPRDVRAWLARVARNASIDLARRKRERAAPEGAMGDCAASEPSDDGALQVVLDGIRQLPESQRTALLMRELAGHSYLEIAALLGTDEDAVRGLIARARVGLRNHREASELPCASARAAVCAEPDRRRLDKTARRHLRSCASCRSYLAALRSDARALRSLAPIEGGTVLGGGALVGVLAKGAVVGTVATQAGAACAVSVCALGGFVLLYEHSHHHPMPSARAAGKPSVALHRSAASGAAPAAGPLNSQHGARFGSLTQRSMAPSSPGRPGAGARAHVSHSPPTTPAPPVPSGNPGEGFSGPAGSDWSNPGRSSPWRNGQGDGRAPGAGDGPGDRGTSGRGWTPGVEQRPGSDGPPPRADGGESHGGSGRGTAGDDGSGSPSSGSSPSGEPTGSTPGSGQPPSGYEPPSGRTPPPGYEPPPGHGDDPGAPPARIGVKNPSYRGKSDISTRS